MSFNQAYGYFVRIASCLALAVCLLTTTASWAEESVRELEISLLHRRLDLRGVRVFDASKERWGSLKPVDRRLFLIHLWAVECLPCVSEMPLLRNIARGWKNDPAVEIVFISETLDEKQLREFWFRTARDRVPEAPLVQSADDRIRDVLGTGKQPVTLLLDRDMVVRQAFIGSLTERTNELTEGMSRLLRAIRGPK